MPAGSVPCEHQLDLLVVSLPDIISVITSSCVSAYSLILVSAADALKVFCGIDTNSVVWFVFKDVIEFLDPDHMEGKVEWPDVDCIHRFYLKYFEL